MQRLYYRATMTLYLDKYRIETGRLRGWDYTSPGYYFATICTQNREEHFGQIVEDKVTLSPMGQAAHGCWVGIPNHYRNIDLDEFVIMPNHMHGIMIINGDGRDVACTHPQVRDVACNVSTISPKPGSLSAVIRSYKSAVTRWCHRHGHLEFAWQPRFYDHVIRDEQSLGHIREYIAFNPFRWAEDEENPVNPHR